MTHYRYGGLLALTAMLVGCQSVEPYVAPDVGPQAKLRIVSFPGNNTAVTEGTNPSCVSEGGRSIAGLGPSQNILSDRGTGRRVGIALIEDVPPKQTTEIIVPAEQPFVVKIEMVHGPVLMASGGTPVATYSWCQRQLVFTPRNGSSYEATYRLNTNTPTISCSVALSRIVTDAAGRSTREKELSYEVVEKKCPRTE